MSAATLSALQGHELLNNVDSFPKRGGMAMVNVGDNLIVIFGGVDRQQEHFNDLLVASVVDGKVTTKVTECSGDVPNPRSGHSMVSYGPYVFLFGGIDFIEEAVYNDIYILDTRSWTWGYVGEGGHEVLGRNSHTMSILKDQEHHVLVVSGGASPEHGPLRDTVYASLPPVDEIDFATIAVTWHLLNSSDAPQNSIPAAEMQSFCSLGNKLIVSGGRDIDGNILNDTWILTATYTAAAAAAAAAAITAATTTTTESPASPSVTSAVSPSVGSFTLRWEKSGSLQLPKPSCAHTSFLQSVGEDILFHTIGGFSYDGLAGYIHSCSISMDTTTGMMQRAGNWTTKTMSGKVATRFGHCLTALPRTFLSALTQTDTKLSRRIPASIKTKMVSVEQATVAQATETTESSSSSTAPTGTRVDSNAAVAAIVFGGVDIEADFNDLWVLI